MLLDARVGVDERADRLRPALMLEPARSRTLTPRHPALQLALQIRLTLGSVTRASSGTRVEAPVVRIAVPSDEREAEDFLCDRPDAVVRVAVGRAPVLRDEAARLVVDRLGRPAELAEDLHVRQRRHLHVQLLAHVPKCARERTHVRMTPGVHGEVSADRKRELEDVRIVDDVGADEEVRRSLVLLLEEVVEIDGRREGLRRRRSARVDAREGDGLTPSSKAMAYMPSGASEMSLSPKQCETVPRKRQHAYSSFRKQRSRSAPVHEQTPFSPVLVPLGYVGLPPTSVAAGNEGILPAALAAL